MRSLRVFVLFLLGVTIVIVPVDRRPASARSPVERVRLGEVNVIAGDRMAGMPVHIPFDATVPKEVFENPNVAYEGAGRVLGVVLVKEGGPLAKAYQFVSTRWDFCGKPGCSGEWQTSMTHGMNWKGRFGYRLPAGDYRLYLIADQAPVRITLTLDGLEGHVELAPERRVVGRLAIPTRADADVEPAIFLGHGRPMRMPTPGLLIDGDAEESGPGASAEGTCFWRAEEGEDEIERDLAGPHCLTFADRGGTGASFSTLPGGGSRSWGTSTVPPGEWKSTYWSTMASPLGSQEFLTLWLAYEDVSRAPWW